MASFSKMRDELITHVERGIARATEAESALKFSESLVKREIHLTRLQMDLKINKLETRTQMGLRQTVERETRIIQNIIGQLNKIVDSIKSETTDIPETELELVTKEVELLIEFIKRKKVKFVENRNLETVFDGHDNFGHFVISTVQPCANGKQQTVKKDLTKDVSDCQRVNELRKDRSITEDHNTAANVSNRINKHTTRIVNDNSANVSDITVSESTIDDTDLDPLSALRTRTTDATRINDIQEAESSEVPYTRGRSGRFTHVESRSSSKEADLDSASVKRDRARQPRRRSHSNDPSRGGRGNYQASRVEQANIEWFGVRGLTSDVRSDVRNRARSASPKSARMNGRSNLSRSSILDHQKQQSETNIEDGDTTERVSIGITMCKNDEKIDLQDAETVTSMQDMKTENSGQDEKNVISEHVAESVRSTNANIDTLNQTKESPMTTVSVGKPSCEIDREVGNTYIKPSILPPATESSEQFCSRSEYCQSPSIVVSSNLDISDAIRQCRDNKETSIKDISTRTGETNQTDRKNTLRLKRLRNRSINGDIELTSNNQVFEQQTTGEARRSSIVEVDIEPISTMLESQYNHKPSQTHIKDTETNNETMNKSQGLENERCHSTREADISCDPEEKRIGTEEETKESQEVSGDTSPNFAPMGTKFEAAAASNCVPIGAKIRDVSNAPCGNTDAKFDAMSKDPHPSTGSTFGTVTKDIGHTTGKKSEATSNDPGPSAQEDFVSHYCTILRNRRSKKHCASKTVEPDSQSSNSTCFTTGISSVREGAGNDKQIDVSNEHREELHRLQQDISDSFNLGNTPLSTVKESIHMSRHRMNNDDPGKLRRNEYKDTIKLVEEHILEENGKDIRTMSKSEHRSKQDTHNKSKLPSFNEMLYNSR